MQVQRARSEIVSYKPQTKVSFSTDDSIKELSTPLDPETGLRSDGRAALELRESSFEFDVVHSAKSSVTARFGNETMTVSIIGPDQLRESQFSNQGRFLCHCSIAPFAHCSARMNPSHGSKSSRRARRKDNDPRSERLNRERCRRISLAVEQALTPAIILERYPKSLIEAHIVILEWDSSDECCVSSAVNSVSLALIDAGIELKDTVTCVRLSHLVSDARLEVGSSLQRMNMMDLSLKEYEVLQKHIACEMTLSYLTSTEQISLFDMTGSLPPSQLKLMLKLCLVGCQQMKETFRNALCEHRKGP